MAAGSDVETYAQLDRDLPERPVELFSPAPGRDSFALFAEVISGAAGAIRDGWQETPGRGALSAALRRSDRGLGLGNYSQLRPIDHGELSFVAIDGGSGCVEPTPQAIAAHRYEPLAEELVLHVSRPLHQGLRTELPPLPLVAAGSRIGWSAARAPGARVAP